MMEEAASQRHQAHREDRQDGDHTHTGAPNTQNYFRDVVTQSRLAFELVAKLQQQNPKLHGSAKDWP
jgi:ABC-type Zn2+ transport system substrate-binding protein/surface adhesin